MKPNRKTMKTQALSAWMAALTVLVGFGSMPQSEATDALIEEKTQAVDLANKAFRDAGLETIFQSLGSPNQFYYLPSTIRFAKDQRGEPMWSVIKFNLAYSGDNIYDEKGRLAVDPDGRVLQGGVFQATFDMGLAPGQLDAIRKNALKPGQKLGRLPLASANLFIQYIDPEDPKKSVNLGPVAAPLTGDLISVTIPLTRSALDILKPIAENPKGTSSAPFTVYIAFSYKGYDDEYAVEVKGSSSSIMDTQHVKTGVEGQYWFFKGSADYENFKQSLIQSNAITVKVLGDAGNNKEKIDAITSKVVDKVLANFMDFSTVTPDPGLAEGKGEPKMEVVNLNEGKKVKDAQGQDTEKDATARNAGLAFSFSMKQSNKSERKDFTFNWNTRTMLTKLDSRYANLDFSYPEKSKGRHYIEATASDWSVARPTISVAPDILPWFNISSVECSYAGKLFQATLVDPGDPTKGKLATMPDWKQAPVQGGTFKYGPVNIPAITDPSGALLPSAKTVNRNTEFTIKFALADKPQLEAGGVGGLDSKDVQVSLDAARTLFNNWYGSGHKILLDASKINGTAALISSATMPPLPKRASFMFRVTDSTGTVDWSKNVAVIPKISQKVNAWVRQAVKAKTDARDGAEKFLEQFVPDTSRPPKDYTVSLANLKPDQNDFFKATDDIFVFLNPDGSDTKFNIDVTVNAGAKVAKVTKQNALPGELVVIDVGAALASAK